MTSLSFLKEIPLSRSKFIFDFLTAKLDSSFHGLFLRKWNEIQYEKSSQGIIDQQRAKKSFECKTDARNYSFSWMMDQELKNCQARLMEAPFD